MTTHTITTEATGRREKTPELAKVEATATGDGESVAAARRMAADRAATIRESVTSVSDARIRTVDRQAEHRSEVFGQEPDEAYRATEKLVIDCVPETAERVFVEVTDAGGTVKTVQFHLREDVHRRLQDEALTEAVERSREKAEQIAAAEGRQVAEVREVTTGEMNLGMESIVDEALGSNPETNLQPTPITVSETVEVVYTLERESAPAE